MTQRLHTLRRPKKTHTARWAVALISLAVSAQAAAQAPASPPADSVTVVPGAHYAAGSLYRAFMGSGYRDLWTTPIRVPVADMDAFGGGLTAIRVGGGTTTRTLHLDGGDGRRYVFRSVDKEPVDLIEEFVGTPIESLLRDQVSSFHPSGALVVASLLDAVDVLHVTPQLVVVPDDPRLGDFRAEFAGMLALFEERPDDGPDGASGFAGSRRIVQTDELFEILEEERGHRVQAVELLRARLIDLLVGDRDRSTNNHLWARFDDDGGFLWRPVPRDRDQAFVQLDGFLKALARTYDPRLVRFDADFGNVAALTRNAWDIDRNFLVGVSRSEWLEVVEDVTRRLTDAVLDRAVRQLPREHYALVGAELYATLRERRDHLGRAAEALYRIVFEYADIQATDADEVATVERRTDGSLRVSVRPADSDEVTFDRVFRPSETREVRLYARGGSDVVTITGGGPGQITVRVIGGGGRDRLEDLSDTDTPVNVFYDGGQGTVVTAASSTRYRDRDAPRPFSWHEDSRTLDWGRSWLSEPRVGYDDDRGVVLTAGAALTEYGFLKSPYAVLTRVRMGWAFGLGQPTIELQQHARDVLAGGDFRLHARWSGADLIDFYGLGNETPELGPASFHRVPHKQFLLSALWGVGDGGRRQIGFGPVFRYLSTDTIAASTYLQQTRPYGSGRFEQLGLQTAYELDGRDRVGTPTEGYHIAGGASLYPDLLSVDRGAFGELHGQAAAFLSPGGGNPTLAVRAQAKKVWGTYPFADAAFLGGRSSLRGAREQRYAGDATLLGSAELRVGVARVAFPIPGDLGVFGLVDHGRVFLEGEASGEWHSGFGGGLWFAPALQPSAFHFTIARSSGRTAYYLGMGFAY